MTMLLKIRKYLQTQGIDYNTTTVSILQKLFKELHTYDDFSDDPANLEEESINKVLERISNTSSKVEASRFQKHLVTHNGVNGVRLSKTDPEAIVIKTNIAYIQNEYVYFKIIKTRLLFMGNSIIKIGIKTNGIPNLLPSKLYPELTGGGNSLMIDDFPTIMKRFVKLNAMLLTQN